MIGFFLTITFRCVETNGLIGLEVFGYFRMTGDFGISYTIDFKCIDSIQKHNYLEMHVLYGYRHGAIIYLYNYETIILINKIVWQREYPDLQVLKQYYSWRCRYKYLWCVYIYTYIFWCCINPKFTQREADKLLGSIKSAGILFGLMINCNTNQTINGVPRLFTEMISQIW